MFNTIQALRGFAAFSVVLFHVARSGRMDNPSILAPFRDWGASGIYLFFAISGFIMVYTQKNHARSAVAFMVNRIVRIVPLYWIVTLIALVLGLYLKRNSAESVDLVHLGTSFAFISGLFSYQYPYLVVGWTLEYEALFYVLFAAAIWLSPKHYVWITLGCLTALAATAIAPPLMMVFAFGMIAALIYPMIGRLALPAVVIGTAIFFTPVFISPESLGTSGGWIRIGFWGASSALIIAGVCALPQIQWRPFLYLGDASYSLYLTHTTAITIFSMVYRKLGLTMQNDLRALLCVVFCLAMGFACYTYIERPLMRWSSKRMRGRAAQTQ